MVALIINLSIMFSLCFLILKKMNFIQFSSFKFLKKRKNLFNFFLFFLAFSTLVSFNSYAASETEIFDFNFIKENYMPLVTVACLVVGYCIKNIKALEEISNDYIPSIMALLGAILGCLTVGFTIHSVIYGAISGVAATGLHQAFTRFINREKE